MNEGTDVYIFKGDQGADWNMPYIPREGEQVNDGDAVWSVENVIYMPSHNTIQIITRLWKKL